MFDFRVRLAKTARRWFLARGRHYTALGSWMGDVLRLAKAGLYDRLWPYRRSADRTMRISWVGALAMMTDV